MLRRSILAASLAALALAPSAARAEVPVQRTFFRLPSSNGHGAVLLDLSQARATHFRDHLFATEEPLIDAQGNDVWTGAGFGSVNSRDLLYDAYFGIRVLGDQAWLTTAPVDLDASGYAAHELGALGGTGVATMVQGLGPLTATQYFFAPRGLPHAAFAMILRITNTGDAPLDSVQAFSLHNFHLGFGRPGVMQDLGEQGETVTYDGSNGRNDLLERAFAGVVVARPLGKVARHAASSAASPASANVYQIVADGGTTDLPDLNGQAPTADGSVSAFQLDLGHIDAGQDVWTGVVFAHHADPFAGATAQAWLDEWVDGRGAEEVLEDEIASWASFQASLAVPAGLEAGEEGLLRQSAVVLAMAQNKEDTAYLRELLTTDGETRYSRFGALPATVSHKGKGAVLASLPPGQWTYAWIRDGSYAAAAMAELGMEGPARDALEYYLNAEAGRFQGWDELSSYDMPPYQISLVRYHGFGVEETDFNDFGPNLELDGFGLFLWALGRYEAATGDTGLADQHWATISQRVADVLVALIDPETGLVRRDSSIWETHWNGRERAWAYTSITAARGLCDAADVADRRGETELAEKYSAAGESIRAAIAARLTDGEGAIASNVEELAAGEGYWDAAVLDAIAMGLFDPKGAIATATLKGIQTHLATEAGAGWARNDDRFDHGGASDLSPWGSDYDSAEWVITDLRGAVATRLAGDVERSDRLLAWVRDQSLANYLAVSETYDEQTGTYKFNAPMAGFGAGAYALALLHREGAEVDPACGAYFVEPTGGGGAGGGGASGAGGAGGDATAATTSATTGAGLSATGVGGGGGESGEALDEGGCACRAGEGRSAPGGLAGLASLALAWAARRRRR
jgi:MYXO-CTERM domain-containing protein